MPLPIAVPIVGVGLVLGAVGLRIASVMKTKNAPPPIAPVPPTAPPQAGVATVPPAPAAATAVLPPVTTNPDGSPHTPGTPFIFASNADAKAAVEEANRLGISAHELILRQQGSLPTSGSGPTPAAAGKRGVVTTNDPAPSGDLIIRTAPNQTAPQIPGGGADKGGIVTIIRDVDSVWTEIDWPGGRRPAGRGFAKKQFIKLI